MTHARTKRVSREYNSHRNRNCWRVFICRSCSEGMDRLISELVAKHGIGRTTDILHEELKELTTSDGGRFTKVAIRDAVRGLAA